MEKDFITALKVISGLVEFIELPEIQNMIDGAYDPEIFVVEGKRLLDKYIEGTITDSYAEKA